MITLLNTGVATLGVVDLPEGITNIDIWRNGIDPHLIYRSHLIPIQPRQKLKLPPGNWIILGRSDEISEEQAKGLVEDCPYFAKCWKQYNELDSSKNTHHTARESFNSWLLSNGITNRVFIIKQINP